MAMAKLPSSTKRPRISRAMDLSQGIGQSSHCAA
jgi:hypothetical protein